MMNLLFFGLYVIIKYIYFDFAFNPAVQNDYPNTVVFLDHLSSTHTAMSGDIGN